MEPITMAATAASILAPYVAKGAEEFIKAVGKDAYEKTKNLFTTLKARWAGNEEATTTLANFEEKPERYTAVLKSILEEELENDSNFRTELSQRLNDIGPYIEIIQKVKRGEDITGIEAESVKRGTVKVDQDMDEVKNVIGAKIKTLG